MLSAIGNTIVETGRSTYKEISTEQWRITLSAIAP